MDLPFASQYASQKYAQLVANKPSKTCLACLCDKPACMFPRGPQTRCKACVVENRKAPRPTRLCDGCFTNIVRQTMICSGCAGQRDLARRALYRENNRCQIAEYNKERRRSNVSLQSRKSARVNAGVKRMVDVKNRKLAREIATSARIEERKLARELAIAVRASAKFVQKSSDGLTSRQRKRISRKNAERQASPPWLSKLQRSEICKRYATAALVGATWVHVDHIIPLRGDTVCGLHVPWNLQILARIDNLAKGNTLVEGCLK
jgi:hypothetical protein